MEIMITFTKRSFQSSISLISTISDTNIETKMTKVYIVLVYPKNSHFVHDTEQHVL